MPICDICRGHIPPEQMVIVWDVNKRGVIEKIDLLHKIHCDDRLLIKSIGPAVLNYWNMLERYRQFEKFHYTRESDRHKVLAAILTTENCTGRDKNMQSIGDILNNLPSLFEQTSAKGEAG